MIVLISQTNDVALYCYIERRDYRLYVLMVVLACSLGMLKDDSTLREIKLTKGGKMMVIGSTIQDVLTVAPPEPETTKPSSSTASKKF